MSSTRSGQHLDDAIEIDDSDADDEVIAWSANEKHLSLLAEKQNRLSPATRQNPTSLGVAAAAPVTRSPVQTYSPSSLSPPPSPYVPLDLAKILHNRKEVTSFENFEAARAALDEKHRAGKCDAKAAEASTPSQRRENMRPSLDTLLTRLKGAGFRKKAPSVHACLDQMAWCGSEGLTRNLSGTHGTASDAPCVARVGRGEKAADSAAGVPHRKRAYDGTGKPLAAPRLTSATLGASSWDNSQLAAKHSLRNAMTHESSRPFLQRFNFPSEKIDAAVNAMDVDSASGGFTDEEARLNDVALEDNIYRSHSHVVRGGGRLLTGKEKPRSCLMTRRNNRTTDALWDNFNSETVAKPHLLSSEKTSSASNSTSSSEAVSGQSAMGSGQLQRFSRVSDHVRNPFTTSPIHCRDGTESGKDVGLPLEITKGTAAEPIEIEDRTFVSFSIDKNVSASQNQTLHSDTDVGRNPEAKDINSTSGGAKRSFNEPASPQELYESDDSSYCVLDERSTLQSSGAAPFGRQRCTGIGGSTYDDAISVSSSDDDDDDMSTDSGDDKLNRSPLLPNASPLSQNATPCVTEEFLEKRERREHEVILNAQRKRRELFSPEQRENSSPRRAQLETERAYDRPNALVCKEMRRLVASMSTSSFRRRRNSAGRSVTGTVVFPPPLSRSVPSVKMLLIVPKVGRSARAMQGDTVDADTSAAKPVSILKKRPPRWVPSTDGTNELLKKIDRNGGEKPATKKKLENPTTLHGVVHDSSSVAAAADAFKSSGSPRALMIVESAVADYAIADCDMVDVQRSKSVVDNVIAILDADESVAKSVTLLKDDPPLCEKTTAGAKDLLPVKTSKDNAGAKPASKTKMEDTLQVKVLDSNTLAASVGIFNVAEASRALAHAVVDSAIAERDMVDAEESVAKSVPTLKRGPLWCEETTAGAKDMLRAKMGVRNAAAKPAIKKSMKDSTTSQANVNDGNAVASATVARHALATVESTIPNNPVGECESVSTPKTPLSWEQTPAYTKDLMPTKMSYRNAEAKPATKSSTKDAATSQAPVHDGKAGTSIVSIAGATHALAAVERFVANKAIIERSVHQQKQERGGTSVLDKLTLSSSSEIPTDAADNRQTTTEPSNAMINSPLDRPFHSRESATEAAGSLSSYSLLGKSEMMLENECPTALLVQSVATIDDPVIPPRNFGGFGSDNQLDMNVLANRGKPVGTSRLISRVKENRYAGRFFDDDKECLFQHHVTSRHFDCEHNENDDNLPAWMVCVEHLSEKSVNKRTGLPTWEFTVHGGDDSVLYSFRAFVGKSSIPGAGYGAFLEFTGARRLNEQSNARRDRLITELVVYEPKTMQPLQAVPEDGGSGVTVLLKGENLHGNYNRLYWPSNARKVLKARILYEAVCKNTVFSKATEKVRIVGEHIHDVLEYEAFSVNQSGSLQPIGHFGIQVACDYVKDPTIRTFFTGVNCIDLGRYGPFRNKDRKPEDLFVLKSFIFSQVPSEWDFSTDEKLHGMLQIIDITEDNTGEPHKLARNELPMYVNEVGHNNNFIQNVYLRDSLDCRVVRYYFVPDRPMEKGKPIELFTNYKSGYEGIRERKGYGLNNLRDGMKADTCVSSRIQRNFSDREDAENVVDVTECVQRLSYLLKFIGTEIWRPIVDRIDALKQACNSGASQMPLSPNQWVAARRVSWLADVFRQKLEKEKQKNLDKSLFRFYEKEINKMLESIDRRASTSFTVAMKLDRGLLGSSVVDAVDDELLEEICYDLRHKLHMVINDSIYCPVAVRLVKSLCRQIAYLWLFREGNSWDDNRRAKQSLLRGFYDAAIASQKQILQSIQQPELGFRDLQFTSGIQYKSVLSGKIEDIFKRFRSSNAFFLQNSLTPKGIVAALIEKLQYNDALSVAGLEPCVDDSTLSFDIDDHLAMIRYEGFDGHDELNGLGSAPVAVSKIAKSQRINETWYIHWQVVWVVDTFARYYLEDADYSLGELCRKLNVDISHSTFVTQRGLHYDHCERYRDFYNLKPGQSEVPTKRKKTLVARPPRVEVRSTIGGRPAAKLVYEGEPKTQFPAKGNWPPGWTQRTYERASGASAGHLDHYWFPPEGSPKLRSHLEILRYLVKRRCA